MNWTQLSNVAVVAVLIILGGAIGAVLTGLDRRLDEWRLDRAKARFYGGDWR